MSNVSNPRCSTGLGDCDRAEPSSDVDCRVLKSIKLRLFFLSAMFAGRVGLNQFQIVDESTQHGMVFLSLFVSMTATVCSCKIVHVVQPLHNKYSQ